MRQFPGFSHARNKRKDLAAHVVLIIAKKKDLQKIESNKIGLKSVQKIVETHHGQLFIQDLPETFVLIITLPYN